RTSGIQHNQRPATVYIDRAETAARNDGVGDDSAAVEIQSADDSAGSAIGPCQAQRGIDDDNCACARKEIIIYIEGGCCRAVRAGGVAISNLERVNIESACANSQRGRGGPGAWTGIALGEVEEVCREVNCSGRKIGDDDRVVAATNRAVVAKINGA